MKKIMNAVILSAGRGTRMSEVTKDRPKCLIEIGGKTILERQIELLLKNSIKVIYVVIGYKADMIRKEIENIENVKIIINEEYATTDNIFSLYLTRDKIKGEEFILLNGDALFEEEIIKNLVNRKKMDIAPVDSKYYDQEELKIREENGMLVEILSKKAPKKMSDGSTIGIFKFSSEGSTILFDEIGKCIKGRMKNKWFEYALNNILREIKMHKIDIHGLKWIEVDDTGDIEKAQELFGR
jgi:choline kinase